MESIDKLDSQRYRKLKTEVSKMNVTKVVNLKIPLGVYEKLQLEGKKMGIKTVGTYLRVKLVDEYISE